MKPESELLTGNEAIARGAWEAGVKVATAYPGTPSTEILENISVYGEIYAQWSVNEKVALEVASGASIEGVRSLAAMKHVGLNVAADPFMTLAYTGVGGGLVLVFADDPDMHSSQNEQDNRYYAKMAKVPMLEPSDSQEAKDFTKAAFDISEKYDCPVLVKSTTRISHSRSLVSLGQRVERKKPEYEKDCRKYVMIPAHGRLRHQVLLKRWEKLTSYVNRSGLNYIYSPKNREPGDVGIITSGISYQYAREVFSGYQILKLALTSPLPEEVIAKFARGKKLLLIVEELEPFLEEGIKSLGLGAEVAGKQYFPQYGELSLATLKEVKRKLFGSREPARSGQGPVNVAPRPPVLCAGCSHRPVFHVLKKLKLRVMGDIGCYTLSVLPPLSSMDTCLCMGAGVGQALGMEKANPGLKGKLVSVIGDSTFFHSGITSLIDNVYNKGSNVIIILDNRITAMTGHQAHPGMGKTLKGEDAGIIWPEEIARAVGAASVQVVDSYDMKGFEDVLKKELSREEVSVIVARQECVLLNKNRGQATFYIDPDACNACGACLKFGCPAIQYRDKTYIIDKLLCTSCGVCVQLCKFDAIKE
ncbi:MAG: indolepyruvate ferredoxin oxidoreductase subunit alpha [Actinomycetota bacterium]